MSNPLAESLKRALAKKTEPEKPAKREDPTTYSTVIFRTGEVLRKLPGKPYTKRPSITPL